MTVRPVPMRHHRPNHRHCRRHRVRENRDRPQMSDRSRGAAGSCSGGERRNAGLARARRSRAVDAAPASVAPRQIPSRPRRPGRWNIVDAGSAEGMAAQYPRQRHPSTAPQSETFDRFVAVHRACRQVPAIVADQQRQRVPVNPDQCAPRIAGQATDGVGTIRAMFLR